MKKEIKAATHIERIRKPLPKSQKLTNQAWDRTGGSASEPPFTGKCKTIPGATC